MEVPHGAGVAFGQPLIELLPVCAGPRVGNAAAHEAELLGPGLDEQSEVHGDAGRMLTGGSDGV